MTAGPGRKAHRVQHIPLQLIFESSTVMLACCYPSADELASVRQAESRGKSFLMLFGDCRKKIHPFSAKDVAEYHHSPLRILAVHLQTTFSVSKRELCKFKLRSIPDITLIRPYKTQYLWRHLTSCLSRGWKRE